MQHLKIYNRQDVLSVTKIRRFETKLGERLQILSNPSDIET
jgi:formiminoglutamase